VQGRRVDSPLGWSMRTIHGGNVILGYVRACKKYRILLLVAGEYGFGASFMSNI